jgi:predicted amidophosphoribosyltransferase
MTTTFVTLKDLFTVTCIGCGSTDVDLSVDACDQCGNSVNAECNACGRKFDGHEFKKRQV